ncbi:MAG: hypothetical protein B6D63_03005 [Candidatus Latescibacteria bacterium 4484_7]|nr:MAG: hypothetical protein B6D63_03005 [Candidatus Latescibacteria bacterium 4484_7]RKZ06429.1 MAG: hypothetical protein DRQ05_04800 [bacterium]
MIVGTGIDITSIKRIKSLIEKKGEKFLQRVFTENEISYCNDRKDSASSFAARFAAKEAFLKALGKGIYQGISLRDISIENDTTGKPAIVLAEGIKVNRDIERFDKIHLSLSHEENLAIAMVIIESY